MAYDRTSEGFFAPLAGLAPTGRYNTQVQPRAQVQDDWFAQQGAPPAASSLFDPVRYEEAYRQGKVPGSPGYEASVRQNPGIDPATGRAWEATDQGGWGQRPTAGAPAPTSGGAPAGGDAAAIIQQWQQTHAPTEPLEGLIAELQRHGIQADAFRRGDIASGNEIALNGQQYKVKTGDNTSWWDPSMGEGGGGPGGMQGALEMAPGYQFRLAEGAKALERSAAARGTLLTGGTLKGLTRYAQDYASGEYNNRYNQLFGLAGLGANAAGAQAGANSQYATTGGDLLTQQGNAQAAGTVGGANAWNQVLGTGANLAQQYYLSRLMQPQGTIMNAGAYPRPGAGQPGYGVLT